MGGGEPRRRVKATREVITLIEHAVASRRALGARYADLPRLAHTRAMAAFAPTLHPMLATPPARVFAPAEVLVLVVLLLHFCFERLFPPFRPRGTAIVSTV